MQAIVVMVTASIIIFTMMRMIPGDPAYIYAGPLPRQEDVVKLQKQFGLNKPWPVQYEIWASNVLKGDMGKSYLSKAPVTDLIAQRLPASAELAVAAMLITILVGVSSGLVAAINNGRKIDTLITSIVGVSVSIPSFWLGILAIFLFAQILGWLPAGGRVSLTSDPVNALKHLFMPALILSSNSAAALSRLVKGSTLEVLHEDYVRTAIAKGLKSRDVILRHVLRNAMVPVVTVIAVQFGRLIGGAIIIETVFFWPGLGRLLINSVGNRDYAVVQGTLLALVFIFTMINLTTDVVYGMLDPRIRVGKSAGS
jgi:peptide/nickel transport system permease protein